jgi:hypothetical protein
VTKKKDPSQLKKRGRPKIPIDYEKAEKLAQILCTQSEIAAVLGISLPTLEHDPEFLRIHKKGMETGRASLRRVQYSAAMKGNATMMIWLGKQYLNQREPTVIIEDFDRSKGEINELFDKMKTEGKLAATAHR